MNILFDLIQSDQLILVFTLMIFSLLGLAILAAILARFGPLFIHNRLYRFAQSAPGLLTTLGVLGTFCGILMGLIDFDVSNIDKSVPQLLEGMKVAFITSVLGMGSAATFRLLESGGRAMFGSYPVGNESDDPAIQLASIREALDRQTNALVGDGEGTIIGTLKMSRVDSIDALKKLEASVTQQLERQIAAFNDFSEHIKENTSKALIEALEGVIRDFNEKLTEQFGENFKQLNQAVKALIVWQDRYRQHIEELESRHRAITEAIERSRDAVSTIAEKAQLIPPMVDGMKQASDRTLQHITAQHTLLDGIAKVRAQAEDAFPKIEQNVLALTENLKGSIEAQRKELDTTLASMGSQLESTFEKAQSAINGKFETFDKHMQKELTRVLSEMGSKLASLSNQFVRDYTPLTKELQRLVSMANGRVRQ